MNAAAAAAGAGVGGAREQLARLLRLVPYLYARTEGERGARLEDAAAALGTTPAQVLADLKVLLMCGLPGGYPDDLIDVDLDALEGDDADGVIRISNADYLARPLRLDPTEAASLIVALRALHASAGPETRAIVDRTIAKLEAAAATGAAARQVDVSGDEPPGDVDPAVLEDALARGRQVRLTYYVPARDEESDRVVDPHRLVTQDGAAYLDAWCHSAEAKRLFRLDRIRSAEVLQTPVATAPEPVEALGESVFEIGTGQVATLRLDAAARWVPEYYPVLSARDVAGGLEVDLAYADPRWLERLLLRLAPHASVVQPPDLADRLARTARTALARYTDGVDS